MRYTERLDECDAVSSVGSKGDSYYNAMAEAFNSLFKAECIRNPVMRPHGGWRSIGEVEWAVAEYIDWFNHRRLHGEINHVPPVEYEAAYWANHSAADYRETPVLAEAGTRLLSLRRTRGDSSPGSYPNETLDPAKLPH